MRWVFGLHSKVPGAGLLHAVSFIACILARVKSPVMTFVQLPLDTLPLSAIAADFQYSTRIRRSAMHLARSWSSSAARGASGRRKAT